jgi:RloB-like protein
MARNSRSGRSSVRIGTGRETDLRRTVGRRTQRTTVLISTNGKSTETRYFKFIKHLPWVSVGHVAVTFTNGSPMQAIREAAQQRTDDDYDVAWVVCDVDEFDTNEAASEARKQDVSLAWSNPCFEVWLLLHREDHAAFLANPRKACERLSKSLGRPWDKSALNFADFEQGIVAAIERAKKLADAPTGNPSTNVWMLLEELGNPTAP